MPALVADQVDTAILHVEQEMLAKSKVPTLHAIARMWELQPKTLYTVAAVTQKTIAEKHAALEAFAKANIEAVAHDVYRQGEGDADPGEVHRLSGKDHLRHLRLPGEELHLGRQQRAVAGYASISLPAS